MVLISLISLHGWSFRRICASRIDYRIRMQMEGQRRPREGTLAWLDRMIEDPDGTRIRRGSDGGPGWPMRRLKLETTHDLLYSHTSRYECSPPWYLDLWGERLLKIDLFLQRERIRVSTRMDLVDAEQSDEMAIQHHTWQIREHDMRHRILPTLPDQATIGNFTMYNAAGHRAHRPPTTTHAVSSPAPRVLSYARRPFRYDRELTKARMRHMMLDGLEHPLGTDLLDTISYQLATVGRWLPEIACGWCGDRSDDDLSSQVVLILSVVTIGPNAVRGFARWQWMSHKGAPIGISARVPSSNQADFVGITDQSRLFCRRCQPAVEEFLCGVRQEATHSSEQPATIEEISHVPQLISDLARIVASFLFAPPQPNIPISCPPRLHFLYVHSYTDDVTTFFNNHTSN